MGVVRAGRGKLGLMGIEQRAKARELETKWQDNRDVRLHFSN